LGISGGVAFLWQGGEFLTPGHEKSKHKGILLAEICGRSVVFCLRDMKKASIREYSRLKSVAEVLYSVSGT
jgi:hypothetical protein